MKRIHHLDLAHIIHEIIYSTTKSPKNQSVIPIMLKNSSGFVGYCCGQNNLCALDFMVP